MSEQDSGQVAIEQNDSFAEGLLNQNSVGEPFLISDNSHPHVKIDAIVALGLERMKDPKVKK